MKQSAKNEAEILDLINKIQSQLLVLDKKIDTLINRPSSDARPTPKPPVNNFPSAKPNDHNKTRQLFKVICADCNKECTIPFKPSGDRPVYCQDCFSRRRVISMSGMKVADKPKEPATAQTTINKAAESQKSQEKGKKKAVAAKKPIAKKKSVPKRK